MTDDRIGAAAETLLAELAAETDALAEAERSARRIRRRRRELQDALSPLMRTMGEERRRRFAARLGQVEALLWDEGRSSGRTRRSAAALRWLIEHDQAEVRAAELNFYLRRAGFDCEPRYAARLLGDWQRKGIVFRVGHGLYRLNLANRSVFAMAIRDIACKEEYQYHTHARGAMNAGGSGP